MPRVFRLISFGVAALFASYAAWQFSTISATLAQNQRPDPPVTRPAATPDTPRPAAARPMEPAYKAVVRLMSDLDDLLDTVHDPASFAQVKPLLRDRVRHHAALAAQHRGEGMEKLSNAGAAEMQKAMNRHAASLARAIQVAPGVREFFEKDLAAIVNGK